MKAQELLKENGELFHKTRTQSDLARHINTREENTANYSLLLGAGSSVTSGIHSAKDLVENWTIELYERYKGEKPENFDTAKTLFEREHASWYNPTNPYSSLFEKKFDLPTQRRRFVEKEVDGKLPSIGYAYLVSLAKEGYFNTIFTTNFDDLINEAFYQFSSIRPIHCAHDSSIHSVSITSKRPKIIKLHGDYLFDDIKSTLRETESLEQNTKEKLVEFCKEYGLIVVGYSGNDRSIMDTVEFLVKQENYLKNGIYWCLREDDEVCHTLRNLFWKEKVYPVIIDGFDEFFAECHHHLLKRPLDLRPNKESKLQQTIQKIIDDDFGISKNKVINRDIFAIKNEISKQDISEFLGDLSKDEDEASDIGIFDLRNLLEIQNLKKKKDYDEAYRLSEHYYYEADSEAAKTRYISNLISISEIQNNTEKALRWSDKLIEIDKNNTGYHILKSDCLKRPKSRYEYLKKQTEKFSRSYEIYNACASHGLQYIENDERLSHDVEKINEISSFLELSLKLEPSLTNSAWGKSYDLLFYKKKISTPDKKNAIHSEISALIEKSKLQNPHHTTTLRLQANLASDKHEEPFTSETLKLIKDAQETAPNKKSKTLSELKNQILYSHFDHEKTDFILKEMEDFYSHNAEKNPFDSSFAILCNCEYLFGIKRQTREAKSIFNLALEKDDSIHYLKKCIAIAKAVDTSKIAHIEQKLENSRDSIAKDYYHEVKSEILMQKGKGNDAIDHIERSLENGMSFSRYLTVISYCLLQNKKYGEIIKIYEKYEDFIETSKHEVFMINLQYAAKKIEDKKYNVVTVRNLSAQSAEPGVKICALTILENFTKASKMASEEIEKNLLNYYSFINWPILENTPVLKGLDARVAS